MDPKDAVELLNKYDVGLVEVSINSEAAKMRIRTAFEWILSSIFRPQGLCPNLIDGIATANGVFRQRIRLSSKSGFSRVAHIVFSIAVGYLSSVVCYTYSGVFSLLSSTGLCHQPVVQSCAITISFPGFTSGAWIPPPSQRLSFRSYHFSLISDSCALYWRPVIGA